MESATALVAETVRGITPFTPLERQHREDALAWTDDIFRRHTPAIPCRSVDLNKLTDRDTGGGHA